MFRLVSFADGKPGDDILTTYISAIASRTIAEGLEFFYGISLRRGEIVMPDMFENMYEDLCGNEFFKGVSGHFTASADHELSDDAVGKEIILRKVKRMQDKMVDTEEYYTFDLLEELIFAHMIECAQEIAGDDAYCWDKEAEKKTEAELKEKFEFSEVDARKVARQCYRLFEMGSEDDAWMEDFEEESLEVHYDDDFWESTSSFGDLFFWDTDYSFFWRKDFIEGLHLIEGGIRDNDGYGYDHACEIFTDIGMKPPASLLGTKEANRITVELEKEKIREAMSELALELTKKRKRSE